MNREEVFKAFGGIDERFIAESIRYAPEDTSGSSERFTEMKAKRMISIALAAALVLALGAAAYAIGSIHAVRQQEIKEDMNIGESVVDSYVEYDVPDGQTEGLVLLSSVNDGEEQRVFVNISPVSEEEAAAFPEDSRFFWRIEGTEIGGNASPQLPADVTVSGTDEIREAVLQNAYDRESQTMTLHCFLDVKMIKSAMSELGTETVPLSLYMRVGEEEPRSFGPISLVLTEEQRRVFDFGHAVYHDRELDRDIEIVGLELTPFSAVWKVHYEGDETFHTPEADWEAYEPWSALEDKVCVETEIIFSDGSSFSTGGALTCPFEDGAVNLWCSWGRAININDIERIVLDGLVLWEK